MPLVTYIPYPKEPESLIEERYNTLVENLGHDNFEFVRHSFHGMFEE